jgi:rubrerythrin
MRDLVQKALDFAIAKEKEAEAFYRDWAEKVTDPSAKALLNELKAAERSHFEMLSRITVDELVAEGKGSSGRPDLKIAELLVDVDPTPSMSLQEAMVVAMKREATSVALYEKLAQLRGEAAALFHGLAEEERRHKSWLEKQYDEAILTEN